MSVKTNRSHREWSSPKKLLGRTKSEDVEPHIRSLLEKSELKVGDLEIDPADKEWPYVRGAISFPRTQGELRYDSDEYDICVGAECCVTRDGSGHFAWTVEPGSIREEEADAVLLRALHDYAKASGVEDGEVEDFILLVRNCEDLQRTLLGHVHNSLKEKICADCTDWRAEEAARRIPALSALLKGDFACAESWVAGMSEEELGTLPVNLLREGSAGAVEWAAKRLGVRVFVNALREQFFPAEASIDALDRLVLCGFPLDELPKAFQEELLTRLGRPGPTPSDLSDRLSVLESLESFVHFHPHLAKVAEAPRTQTVELLQTLAEVEKVSAPYREVARLLAGNADLLDRAHGIKWEGMYDRQLAYALLKLLNTDCITAREILGRWESRVCFRIPFRGEEITYSYEGQADDVRMVKSLERFLPRSAREKAQERLASFFASLASLANIAREDLPELFKADLIKTPTEDEGELNRTLDHYRSLNVLHGLTKEHPEMFGYVTSFPKARSIKRRVTAYLGPTNSGKTCRAVQQLAKAASGCYLGPLRLLALENQERLETSNVPCSLLTGDERVLLDANHVSSTIEMADLGRNVEVAVIDEFQLVGSERGWACTNAYCGVPARHIYVTGSPNCEPNLRRLAELCRDELEIIYTERFSPLKPSGVIDPQDLPPKSAVIVFSRAMALDVQAVLEARGKKCAVIYGALGPEVRREEAKRLREGQVDCVVATDAIGMGLNLPLSHIYFWETDKWDGKDDRPLSAAEILQIAGRAGRGKEPGSAGAFSARDFERVREALLNGNLGELPSRMPVTASWENLSWIAEHLESASLRTLLVFFRSHIKYQGADFEAVSDEEVCDRAEQLDKMLPWLPLSARFSLVKAPWHQEDLYWDFVLRQLERSKMVHAPEMPDKNANLESLESCHHQCCVYAWLHYQEPRLFPQIKATNRLRELVSRKILEKLRQPVPTDVSRRECRFCRRAILPSSTWTLCAKCHKRGRKKPLRKALLELNDYEGGFADEEVESLDDSVGAD